MERRTNKQLRHAGYKYKIGYLDPTDEKGMRFKTWHFKTYSGAKDKQKDLMVFWGVYERDVKITSIR